MMAIESETSDRRYIAVVIMWLLTKGTHEINKLLNFFEKLKYLVNYCVEVVSCWRLSCCHC